VRTRAEQYTAAKELHALGPQWVLVKGGHLRDDPECLDLLYDGAEFTELLGPRFDTRHTHGGGDSLASAITSALARGRSMPDAVRYGKRYIEQAVAHAYPLGAGTGPVSPFWRLLPD
jgi:hydroxymethylpyrimidine/phosphomethylpyrimidine kinase